MRGRYLERMEWMLGVAVGVLVDSGERQSEVRAELSVHQAGRMTVRGGEIQGERVVQ